MGHARVLTKSCALPSPPSHLRKRKIQANAVDVVIGITLNFLCFFFFKGKSFANFSLLTIHKTNELQDNLK